MQGCWDIDITNLIFWNISFADNVRAIKVDSTPRISSLRNQMVSSVLISDAGMMRYRYHEFDIYMLSYGLSRISPSIMAQKPVSARGRRARGLIHRLGPWYEDWYSSAHMMICVSYNKEEKAFVWNIKLIHIKFVKIFLYSRFMIIIKNI